MDRLVLWDVDGTLVHTRGIGAAVFDRALAQVLGVGPASRLFLSGKTDPSWPPSGSSGGSISRSGPTAATTPTGRSSCPSPWTGPAAYGA